MPAVPLYDIPRSMFDNGTVGVPMAPLGKAVTTGKLGKRCVKEHHNWAKWRRKYPNLDAYLKANPGPVGRLVNAPWEWLSHYRGLLEEKLQQHIGYLKHIPGKTPDEKRSWIRRVLDNFPTKEK